jgi:two-component system cell cycle sensor histidine kinase/response regulator CckA
MLKSLKVLLVEDMENDAVLIVRELRKQGYDPIHERVDTAEAMLAALENNNWDIILTDHNMPSFNSGVALEIRKQKAPHLPIILVSGTIGEEATVQAVKAGIDDFVNKADLGRVVPVLERVLREEENRSRREQAENQLHETETLLSSIFEADPTGVALTVNGVYKNVNRMFCVITGYSAEELIGQNSRAISANKNEFERVSKEIELKLPKKNPLELECSCTHKDGSIHDILLSVSPFNADDFSEGLVWAILDITERKQTATSLMRLDAAINTIDETIIITNTQGIIQYVNPAFERSTGYSNDEALGANIHMLESGKHDQDFYQHMQQAVARGDIWKGLVVNKKKDGSFYDVEATLSCTQLPDGTVTNYITVQRDVTRELKLEQQYRQAQKMEAIGALAGGIAHDFNNILAAIMGYTQIAIDTVKDRPATSKHLQAILKATDRAGSLVKQILTFSRKTDQETTPVMPKTIIKEALKLLRASLPSTIEMREVIRSDSVVLADPTHIHQVIMNLCTNAGYAMRKKGGTLKISLDDVNLDTASAEQNPGLSPGQHVKLCVTDTGNGISPEVIERIFDPFFTTKPHGEGTGLGLSVIHGIIKSCEGAISVQSEIGKGTVFQIYLPIIQAKVPIATQKPEAIPRGTENILFVDDEPMLVDISKKILESLGYRVAVCTASDEALAVFKKEPMAFDAVLTDYTMPKMTGLELAQEIINIRPDIPIILCTGNTETITQQKGKDIGICECILKPLKIHDLATTLRKIFDKQPA